LAVAGSWGLAGARDELEDDKDLGGCSVSFNGNIFNLQNLKRDTNR
jgi:predicted HAD superfamily phosphohydrolase